MKLFVQIYKEFTQHRIGFGIAGINIVSPKSGAIVLGGITAEMAIGDEEIAVAIKVEVGACNPPAPSRACHLMVVGRLGKAIFPAEEKAVTVAHLHAVILVPGKILTTGLHGFQPACSGRAHPGHV